MSHTGTNAFEVLLDNNSHYDERHDVALAFSFTGLAQDGDITIRNGNTITAANASAMTFTATATNADVEFASDGNMFTNNSASNAANFLVNNGAVLNATLTNSSYTNPSAAAFAMTSDGMTTHINLDLTGNTSNNTYELTTMNQGVPGTDFNFSVVDRDNTAANNAGTVNFNPAIGDFGILRGRSNYRRCRNKWPSATPGACSPKTAGGTNRESTDAQRSDRGQEQTAWLGNGVGGRKQGFARSAALHRGRCVGREIRRRLCKIRLDGRLRLGRDQRIGHDKGLLDKHLKAVALNWVARESQITGIGAERRVARLVLYLQSHDLVDDGQIGDLCEDRKVGI